MLVHLHKVFPRMMPQYCLIFTQSKIVSVISKYIFLVFISQATRNGIRVADLIADFGGFTEK